MDYAALITQCEQLIAGVEAVREAYEGPLVIDRQLLIAGHGLRAAVDMMRDRQAYMETPR